MKTKNNSDNRCLTKMLVIAIIILCGFQPKQLFSQDDFYGPSNPPPKESSIAAPGNDSLIGRTNGKLYTITNITLANSTTVYWTMLAGSIGLSMDGTEYTGSEVMSYDAAESDLPSGIAAWTGETQIPIDGQSPRALDSKFTITVTNHLDNPIALTNPVSIGFSNDYGGMVTIIENTMVFKVRMEMFVSDNGGSTWIPHLNYFDNAQTPPGAEGTACSAYDFGFYWLNDPPELQTNQTIYVNEADTATIRNTLLRATDVESAPDELLFIFDPLQGGLLPENGVLLNTNELVLPGDTFTMADITNEIIEYVHDGTETHSDLIPLMLVDCDGEKYRSGEDSIFYVTITVTPADDIPTVVLNEGLDLDEEETLALDNTMLLTTDPESDPDNITYTLDPSANSDYPEHGLLLLNSIPLSDGSTFTQVDVNSGNVEYQHDGSENFVDGFVFQVEDEYGHLAENGESTIFFFPINITSINDAPILTVLSILEVVLFSEEIVTNTHLAATDAESAPGDITFTIDPDANIMNPTEGVLKLNGTVLSDGETFTVSDINNNRVSYEHTGAGLDIDFVPFSIVDGDGAVASDGGFTIFHLNITIVEPSDLPIISTDQKELFTVFPIPVKDNLTIVFSNNIQGQVNLAVLNVLGEYLWKESRDVSETCIIPLTDYPRGLYFIQAETGEGIQIQQIYKD